jgi:hypothetical protein
MFSTTVRIDKREDAATAISETKTHVGKNSHFVNQPKVVFIKVS